MRDRQIISVRNTERVIPTLEQREHVVFHPRLMAKLKGGFGSGRQAVEECCQPGQILFHVRRQLKQNDTQAIFEYGHGVEQILGLVLYLLQSLEVSDALRRFYGKAK